MVETIVVFQPGIIKGFGIMKSLILQSKDPYFNLAAEDYLLHDKSDDFLILSINDPSVIIGKHQVANREVNMRFTGEMNIPVIRRISGGGAVYHDRGNLNFAFIRQSEHGKQVDFALYTKPVIEFLGSVGIDAIFGGKNDITVNGLKVSGNAEHVFRERVLHHGTLLFDASVDNMRKALRPANGNFSSRGVESNRTSVSNLKGMGGMPGTIEELSSMMLAFFNITFPSMQSYTLEGTEIKTIMTIAQSKYMTWEWNFAYGPPYTFTNEFSSSGKKYGCRFMVKDGIIWESDIEGSVEIAAAGKKLIGCRHIYSDVSKILRSENSEMTDEEIYNLL
jgi:lipoate-protein ligase A